MKKLLIALLVGVALTGCEDVIDVDLDQGEPLLAVEAWISDTAAYSYVRLSETSPYFQNEPPTPVSGATVVVSDDLGQSDTLRETAAGFYPIANLPGVIGRSYALTIDYAGETYRANTEVKRVPEVDSIVSLFRLESPTWEEGYYILYYGPEPVGEGDFYRFRVFVNGMLLDRPEELLYASDELVDGNYIEGIELNFAPFAEGDTIDVEGWSINEDHYYFFDELARQTNNGGLFADPLANVRTNIVNVRADGPPAVGFFGGAAVRRAQRVMGD